MDSTGLNYCCGMMEIGNLGGWEGTDRDLVSELRGELNGIGDHFTAAIATTVPDQKKAIAALRAHKFEPLKTFTSVSTGSRITLWFKKIRTRDSA